MVSSYAINVYAVWLPESSMIISQYDFDYFLERVFKYELSKSVRELSIPQGINFYIGKRETLISIWVMSSNIFQEKWPFLKG